MQGAYNDPFQRVANAEVGEKTAYFEPGVYPFLYLDVIKMVTSRKGDQLFIAEFDIVDSDVPSRPKGSRAAWIANFRHEPTPGNVRGFMAALNNVGVEEITADALRFACSDKNPCHGNLIRLEAVLLTTDKDGNARAKPFTRHDWRPVPKELQGQAEELRTKAGFPGF
jgi:hypothetical protein